MTPFDTYKQYLAFKNHFTKPNYDYHQYCGKSRASKEAFNKRKDRYFFERMSRKKTDDEIKLYFLANFVECDDPTKLWIGEIIESGEENYANWLKRSNEIRHRPYWKEAENQKYTYFYPEGSVKASDFNRYAKNSIESKVKRFLGNFLWTANVFRTIHHAQKKNKFQKISILLSIFQ